ncbi:MAG: hypothetical protein RIR34_841 [Actinomycetota bacterium]
MAGGWVSRHGISLFLVIKRQRQVEPSEGYWFNTKTLKVESGLLTAAPYRIGPFKTADEAARALEIIRERSMAWSESEKNEDQR